MTAIEINAGKVRLLQVVRARAHLVVERTEEAERLEALTLTPQIKSSRCIVALPREEVFSRTMTLPATHPDELQPMVALQAKNLPVMGETEVVFDYMRLQQANDQTDILLFGIDRPSVDRYLASFAQAGFPSPELTLTTSGLLNWYRATRAQMPATGTLALIELDTPTAECLIVSGDALRFTRSIPMNFSNAWFDEFDRTLESYRKEHPDDIPTTVVLTGDPSLVTTMRAPLEAWVNLPVQVVDTWTPAVKAKEGALPQHGSWSTPLGLLLPTAQPAFVNLLPLPMQRMRLQRAIQRRWVVTAGLVLALLLGVAGWLQLDLHQQQALHAQSTQVLQRVAPQATALRREITRLERVHQILEQRGFMTRLLEDLYDRTPAAVSLRQWAYDTKRDVRISGYAPALRDVLAYVGALEQSAYLADVQLRYSAKRASRSGVQIDFEVVGRAVTTPAQDDLP